MPTDRPSSSVNKRLLSGLQRGAARGAIGAVNRKFAAVIIEKAGGALPEALRGELGIQLIAGLLPFLVLQGMNMPQLGGRLPDNIRAQVEKIAEMAWDDFASTTADKVLGEVFKMAEPMLAEYMVAAKLLDNEAVTEEEDDIEVTPQKKQESRVIRDLG